MLPYWKTYHVGDRVISTVDRLKRVRLEKGSLGTIVYINKYAIIKKPSTRCIAVEWDDEVGGHNCNKRTKDGHGFWVQPNWIELKGCDTHDDYYITTEQDYNIYDFLFGN